MNNQVMIDKIQKFYFKYDDYIKYNFYIFFTVFIYPFLFLLLPSLFFNILIPVITIPVIFYKYFKKHNYQFIKFKVLLFFILTWYQFGWLIKFDMFDFQFKSEIYYFLISSLFISIIFLNNKVKLRHFLLNFLISIFLHLIVLSIALNNFEKQIYLSINWYSLLHLSIFLQVINTLIFIDRSSLQSIVIQKNQSYYEYFHLSYLILLIVSNYYLFNNYNEDFYNNKIYNENLYKFREIEYNGFVEMIKIRNNLVKIKYHNEEVIFYIQDIYRCQTNKKPDILIEIKDVNVLKISKEKNSNKFNFQLNGQCLEASMFLTNY